uniref:Uncharacterized protein n=1 Tax=Arion vulgaris TaxID=1028688 RepID=A0A0B6ZHW8_9EUPU
MSARIVYIGIYLMVTTLIHKTSTEQLQKLKEEIATLARQVMLQQLSIEDKVRTDGGSGIKQVRIKKGGPETYYTNSHTGDSIAAIHDHSNYRNTAGQGEGRFVLNGVEFSTRHNDYLLRMPSRKLSTYHLVEDIPFPPVPRDVLIKPTVQEQVSSPSI